MGADPIEPTGSVGSQRLPKTGGAVRGKLVRCEALAMDEEGAGQRAAERVHARSVQDMRAPKDKFLLSILLQRSIARVGGFQIKGGLVIGRAKPAW